MHERSDKWDLGLQRRFAVKPRGKSETGLAGRKSVLLVDRHALMRQVAAEWINRCDGLTVCGVAGGGAEALQAIRRLHPDIVVSEIMRPRDLRFIRELHRRHPHLPILVFTTQDEALYRGPAAEAGASGYLMKQAGGDKLVERVSAVLRAMAPVDRRSSYAEKGALASDTPP